MHWKTALILGASLVVAVIAHDLLSNPTDRGKIRYVVELESSALRQLSDSQLKPENDRDRAAVPASRWRESGLCPLRQSELLPVRSGEPNADHSTRRQRELAESACG